MSNRKIVILSDFGKEDVYVGIMKGVIKKINPIADITDLYNNIEPGNIKQAGFLLANSYRDFPKDSVFLCVVDPGVGSNRKAIIVESDNYFFVAPDNGLLSIITDQPKKHTAFQIQIEKISGGRYSHTFHGRDVFAPAAGYLSIDKNINDFSNEINIKNLVRTDIINNYKGFVGEIEGKILHIDRFGNAVSSIHESELEDRMIVSVKINGKVYAGFGRTFSSVMPGEVVTYTGSFDYKETGIRDGNFAEKYNIRIGNTITIEYQ